MTQTSDSGQGILWAPVWYSSSSPLELKLFSKKTFGKIASQGKMAEKELGKASIFSFTRVPRHVWYNSFSREGRLGSVALGAPA
jgi:hypothetical protein